VRTFGDNEFIMTAVHEERFIPVRKKLDQLSIVKDYAAVPRLEYR
jgi:V-type H+-transporting ATPase subunit B